MLSRRAKREFERRLGRALRKQLVALAGDAGCWAEAVRVREMHSGQQRRIPVVGPPGRLGELLDLFVWRADLNGVNFPPTRLPRRLRRGFRGGELRLLKEPFEKETWGEGPWETEPDWLEWKHRGLRCFARRNPVTGGWCGYVGVPVGHPLWGDNGRCLEVHGGINFLQDDGENWWFGFDCGHAGDCMPAIEARLPPDLRARMHNTQMVWPGTRLLMHVYRPLAYVRGECERLIEQIHARTDYLMRGSN